MMRHQGDDGLPGIGSHFISCLIPGGDIWILENGAIGSYYLVHILNIEGNFSICQEIKCPFSQFLCPAVRGLHPRLFIILLHILVVIMHDRNSADHIPVFLICLAISDIFELNEEVRIAMLINAAVSLERNRRVTASFLKKTAT
jgi:hypothetical protein